MVSQRIKYTKGKKLLFLLSSLFGTPIIILLWLCYNYTFRKNLDVGETKYLRSECFMKFKNIYLSENRYDYHKLNFQVQVVEDSIIISEVYRWGTIKSCNIIRQGKIVKIDTADINFLTKEQKKEILKY